MRMINLSIGLIAAFFVLTNDAFADDNSELNDIYREFWRSPADVEKIESLYRDDIIHVGRPDTLLIRGKKTFMDTNILPLTKMVNAGQLEFSGKVFVVRRHIEGNMANDVGYLHMQVQQPGGEAITQLQKFSWVFLKEDDRWRVLTDFDATPAPLAGIETIEPQFTIE